MGRLALAIKVPLGTRLLHTDQLLVLTLLFAVLILVSSHTGFSPHLRYVLPIFPFAFIWISRLAREVAGTRGPLKYLVAIFIIWSVTSSLYQLSVSSLTHGTAPPEHPRERKRCPSPIPSVHSSSNTAAAEPNSAYVSTGHNQDTLAAGAAGVDPAKQCAVVWRQFSEREKNRQCSRSNCPDAGIQYPPGPARERLRSRDGTFDEYLRRQPVDMVGYSIYVYRIESPSQMRN